MSNGALSGTRHFFAAMTAALSTALPLSIGMAQSTTIGVVPIRGAQPAVPTPPPSPYAGTGGVTPAP